MKRSLAIAICFVAACGEATVVCPEGKELLEGDVCGDKLVCAEGTVEHDGECVGFDPNDTTPPTVTADPPGSVALASPEVVVLTADEPATIYFTTNGSEPSAGSESAPSPVSVFDLANDAELKFMAIDLAGNQSEVSTELYAVDDDPPGSVTDLAASVEGNAIRVTWTNPSDDDFAGVLVVRSVTEPEFTPVTPESYAEGPVADTEDILLVDNDTMLLDPTPFAGFDRYTVWTYDALGNYGAPVWATTDAPIPVPEQTGTFEIDLTTGAVTVIQQPTSFTLSGTSTVDLSGGTVDATIDLESAVGRPFFNTKLMLETVSDGTTAGDGLLDSVPFVHYGVRAMVTGETRSDDFTITGVTGAVDPIVVTVKIRDDPVMIHSIGSNVGGLALSDSTGTGASATVSCQPLAWTGPFGSSRCMFREAVMSQDGQFIYAANTWGTEVVSIDSSTLSVVAGVDLHPNGGVGSTSSLTRSPDGKYIYALVTLNGHYRGSGTVQGQGGAREVNLVKLDGNSLEEVARLSLFSGGQQSLAMRSLSMTADGTLGATLSANQSTLYIIDLENMTLVDSTSTSMYVSSPSVVGIEPDGDYVWFASRSSNANEIYRMEIATKVVDTITLTDTVSRPAQIAFGPNDGVLYYARKSPSTTTNGLTLIDTTTLAEMPRHYLNTAVKGVTFSPDGTIAYFPIRDLAGTESEIARFDAETHAPIDSFPTAGGSERSGHFMFLSPF